MANTERDPDTDLSLTNTDISDGSSTVGYGWSDLTSPSYTDFSPGQSVHNNKVVYFCVLAVN